MKVIRTQDQNVVVSMRGIVKRFPGVLAHDQVNFELKAGEIHGLLGENGAGKSTLMNILYGFYHADEGTIEVFNKTVHFRSPADAIKTGVGMVHQHLQLVSDMTVTENIILGLKSAKGFMIDLPPAEKHITELGKRYSLHVNPKEQIWQLSIGEKQRVEIL